MADINKVAAICIRDKKVLIVHKKTIGHYITLGGKIEPGENELTCLQREVKEEVGCSVRNPVHFGTFEGASIDNKSIKQSCYLCELEGEITLNPHDNIDGILWVGRDYPDKKLPLAPMLEQVILPKLVEQGLI